MEKVESRVGERRREAGMTQEELAGGTPVEVWQDGKLITTLTISASTLYTLVENAAPGTHTIKLIVKGPGLEAYTLDFD